MGVIGGEETIVQDGLVYAVDPVNSISFTSGSATVYDLINPSVSGSTINDNSPGPLDGGNGYWEFDGTDDYISFSQQSFLEGKTNLTVSCWHQATAAVNKVLWGASVTSGGYLVCLIYHSSNRIYFEYNNGGTQYGTTSGTGDLAVDEWGEITFVLDDSGGSAANNVKMYINGEYVAWASTSGGAFSSTAASLNPLTLGTDGHYGGYDWQGYIGPTMVYNRSLSAAEVLKNYNTLKGRFGL